jgi:hypothetical protein
MKKAGSRQSLFLWKNIEACETILSPKPVTHFFSPGFLGVLRGKYLPESRNISTLTAYAELYPEMNDRNP